jgi:hypothetical protein
VVTPPPPLPASQSTYSLDESTTSLLTFGELEVRSAPSFLSRPSPASISSLLYTRRSAVAVRGEQQSQHREGIGGGRWCLCQVGPKLEAVVAAGERWEARYKAAALLRESSPEIARMTASQYVHLHRGPRLLRPLSLPLSLSLSLWHLFRATSNLASPGPLLTTPIGCHRCRRQMAEFERFRDVFAARLERYLSELFFSLVPVPSSTS